MIDKLDTTRQHVNRHESLLKENIELRIQKEKLLEAAKHIFIFSGIIQQDASLDDKFDMAKEALKKAIAKAESKL